MRHPHVSSGGRYPALRTIAVLYLVAALFVTVVGVWRAVQVFRGGDDPTTADMVGPMNDAWGRALGGLVWLAVTFIAVLGMFALAELIKLFIDIEHNTRAMSLHSATAAATTAGDGRGAATHEGPAVPFVGERKILEGDETAEGALLRGH